MRPRKGSTATCSRCHRPAPGYDQLGERRFEFIRLWGFLVFLLYTMRRVDGRRCGAVIVEEVPWGNGKRTLTRAYMLFLARWARRLSWKETAGAFRTSWDKVFDAVEHVVTWGLEHRTLGQIDAIGVDEIQYAKGHKCLTLVYQIDIGVTRLLWVGKERTIESFQGFFTAMGQEVISKIVFICPDAGADRNVRKHRAGLLRQPTWWNFDAALDKKVSIRERVAVRLRFQAFNVFNHTEFNSIGTTYQWNAAGVNLNTTTGQFLATQPPRQMALTARVEF